MEGMLMLPVILLITVVLTCALDGGQRKHAVSLLICAAMMIAYIPAINAAKADSAAKPVLAGEQVLVNGTKAAQPGAVTYSASGEFYQLDTTSARVRVKNGDSISFEGTISAPEGETISWIRVDVYDAATQEPYTVGAEYYRADNMRVQQYDLANIPALTIGEAFGSKDYMLAEGGKYIVMFCVGDSSGNGFADMDANVEEDQGPAVLVEVKMSAGNCVHPHSDYQYALHSSGETRKHSYGDGMTHQVEQLYERYCGLCDTFLMNIWGAGIAEEHTLDINGVCLGCGYYSEMPAEGEMADEEAENDENAQSGEIAEGSADTLEMLFENIIKTTNPDRRVSVRASWENEKLAIGDMLTLSAELTGYEGLSYTIFWQCDRGNGFEDVDVADGHASIQFMVNEENKLWRWRAGVSIDVEIPDAEEGIPVIQGDADKPEEVAKAEEQTSSASADNQEAAE